MHPVLSSSWLVISSSSWTCIHPGCDPRVSEHGATALHLLYCKWSTFSWLYVCMMQRDTPNVYSKDDLTDACISRFDVWNMYLEISTMIDLMLQNWLDVGHTERVEWANLKLLAPPVWVLSLATWREMKRSQNNDQLMIIVLCCSVLMLKQWYHTPHILQYIELFLLLSWWAHGNLVCSHSLSLSSTTHSLSLIHCTVGDSSSCRIFSLI